MHALALAAMLVAAQPPRFETEVLPLLTKAGCNSGACHGAAAGRGGLKLSLFAGNPAADYDALVRELEGRRINRTKPAESHSGRAPHIARSFTVPLTARSPMSPPGKNSGETT